MTSGFVVNKNTVNFFLGGPLLVLWFGQGVKNDMSDQYNDSLMVCNVKIRKSLLGWKCTYFQLLPSSVKRFELFFSQMVKLEEKESPDSKLSDFE